jgi:hypothetical protein
LGTRESPRIRRLRTDLKIAEQLRNDSTIFDFSVSRALPGMPPEGYVFSFRGRGLWRRNGSAEILVREHHEVSVYLGASYPRMMPELSWRTPIFHPNISASGIVCLGGYGTHWVPSLNFDELCTMLWDMIRYANFDVESPYNRQAALWAKSQDQGRFPIDARPLRDKLAGVAPLDVNCRPPIMAEPQQVPIAELLASDEVVDAEILEPGDGDILFID